MRIRKVAFSVSLLVLSIYILLPTPDEIVIHPILGFFLANLFNLNLIYAVLLSVVVYRAVGLACLLAALLIGGKPIYHKLKERMKRRETRNEAKATEEEYLMS